MSDCIFCKIAAGELGTEFVYENDYAVAFNDLNPQAPVHVLVVPKKHYENICDDVDQETLSAMVRAVVCVAEKTGVAKTGFRTIMNTGSDAGQTVNHLHMHVIGGTNLGEGII